MKDQLKKTVPIYSEICPVIHALEIIGGKWRIPIIFKLSTEKGIRYNELKRLVPGITNIMLTRSLQSLEEHGLVKRIEYTHIKKAPSETKNFTPHVEYSLTDTCHDLLPALGIINEWGKKVCH